MMAKSSMKYKMQVIFVKKRRFAVNFLCPLQSVADSTMPCHPKIFDVWLGFD
uniref:Uncharacterized protein n=1 Tax=Kalanchoe fedtschenkoi TaxID=63787 RepID=A0A7N0UZP7_KALFE